MESENILKGSDRHTKIIGALKARIDLSKSGMSDLHKKWKEADTTHQMAITETEADNLRKGEKDDGIPHFLTIEVPYTYAMLMSAHTYWTSAMLSRDPVLQYSGRHGEAEMNVQAVEALMGYQHQGGGHQSNYYVWLHDAGKYGLGVLGHYWEEEVHHVSQFVEMPVENGTIEGKTKRVKQIKKIEGYKGNKTFNVRPYDYFPDTRVPLTDPQKGEFVGRYVEIPWTTVIERKLNGQYIKGNVDILEKSYKKNPYGEREDSGGGIVLPGSSSDFSMGSSDSTMIAPVSAYEVVVHLVPKAWTLGQSEYPEKWVFTYAAGAGDILLEARPLGLYHNRFPFAVLETEIEGYSLKKRGMLEIGKPLNDTMTWLFNSHFYSVRKSLNGEIIYDPSRVYAKDLLDDRAGKRIRMKPRGYGSDVRSAVSTIQGNSADTQNHLRDVQVMEQLTQRVLGVNDNIMGAVNSGGRKSATEIRASGSASANRMKTIVEYFSATGFEPHAQMMLQTSQQLYSGDTKLKIVGDQISNAESFIQITEETIAGNYDYIPVDGSLPVDNFALVNSWSTLLQQMKQYPEVSQQYDIGKIFGWVGQKAGLKNIKQFKVNIQDPEQIQQQIQRGNLVSVGEGNGRGGRETARPKARGSEGGSPVIPLPNQIPGMGPSG